MHKRYRKQGFRNWWRGINRHDTKRKQHILSQWLKYSCKTIALRGDVDQQAVVYTIANRFNNSEYKKISRANAKRVYDICNKKQQKYREEIAQLKRMRENISHNVKHNIPVEIKRTRSTRKIVSHGR